MNIRPKTISQLIPKLLGLVMILCAFDGFSQALDSTRNHYDSLSQAKISKLDSLKNGLTKKIDSLGRLNLSTEKYTAQLDSLNKINPQQYLDKINTKVNSLESKINDPVKRIETKINDLPVDAPNVDVGNVNIKDLSIDKDLSLNKDLSINKDLDIDSKLKDVSDVSLNSKDINLGKDLKIDEIKDAQQKLGELNQATEKVQSYEEEVKSIADGKIGEVKELPNTIENKAKELDEVKELQKQTGEIDKAKGMIDKGKDPEAMKTMATTEIKKQAVDHFRGHEQALQSAIDKLSKFKEKYPDVSSIEDITKRPPNPLKGKPVIERILPGITLQVQKGNHVMIDFNPVVSYLFTPRINAGLGWNERFSFAKWNRLSSDERIYGPRVFGSFGFKKGFAVKAEIERMNALVPASYLSSDGTRQWVWSAFVGLKKDYKFIGQARGNVQILYNIYDDHDNSPYPDRINVRMGFEFPMKKKPKPSKQDQN